VDSVETVSLMAIETAAFKREPTAPAQAAALCALHTGNRRMLVKRLEPGRRIPTDKKVRFLLAAFPDQCQ
jgi:hypothetical protein